MDFEFGTADSLVIKDSELIELLSRVYVEGGYTKPDDAISMFDPSNVRQRGLILGVRETQSSDLAGMIIIVPPDSPARRLAKNNEAEVHLLGVKPEFRRHGLGKRLIEAVIHKAKQNDYSKLILWTQISMKSAQQLYEASGFVHVNDMERNGRVFKVYELELHR